MGASPENGPIIIPKSELCSLTLSGGWKMPRRDGALLVLIVDDEEIIADTLSLILNESGLDARAAYLGETALVLARLLMPDVLISDILMGGMTGIDLAIHVERELPDCRIILYSGQSVTTDLLQTVESEGHRFEFLSKPVHPQVVLNRLASLRMNES